MTEQDLRQEIVSVAQAIDRAGFCPSKSGNVSSRFGDGLPTFAAKLFMLRHIA